MPASLSPLRFGMFLASVLAVALLAYNINQQIASSENAKNAQLLETVYQHKVQAFHLWLKKLYSDAKHFQGTSQVNPIFSDLAQSTGLPQQHPTLSPARLEEMRTLGGYALVALLNPQGKMQSHAGEAPTKIPQRSLALAHQSRKDHRLITSDFYAEQDLLYLDVFFALDKTPQSPVLWLKKPASEALRTSLLAWPDAPPGGEILLSRAAKDRVTVIFPPQSSGKKPFEIQLRPGQSRAPAVLASFKAPTTWQKTGFLGTTIGIGQTEVFALARAIPETPWTLTIQHAPPTSPYPLLAMPPAIWAALLAILAASLALLATAGSTKKAKGLETDTSKSFDLLSTTPPSGATPSTNNHMLIEQLPAALFHMRKNSGGALSTLWGNPAFHETCHPKPGTAEHAFGFCSTIIKEDIPLLLEALDKASTSEEKSWAVEFRIILPGETKPRWILARGTPKFSIAQTHEWTGVLVDVTDYKMALEQASDNEAAYAAITASVPGIIFQWRVNGKTAHQPAYMSPRVRDIFGFTPEEILGRWRDTLVPHISDYPSFEQSLLTAARKQEPWRWEGEVTTKLGEKRFIEIIAYPIPFHHNDIVFNGYMADISERKQIEQALRQREERYRSIVNLSPAGFVMFDEEQTLVEVNDALCQMLDFGCEDLLGAGPETIMDEDNIKRWTAIAGPQKTKQEQHYELTLTTRSGENIPVMMHGRNIANEQGGLFFFAFIIDFRERKTLEEKILNLAHHDTLTGLPNRALLYDRFNHMFPHSKRHGAWLGIALLDLDGFKKVNDQLGHEMGDQLLCKVAERLRGLVRASDTIARLGGDEFVLLIEAEKAKEDLYTALTRLVDHLAQPYIMQETTVDWVSASIGITIIPDDSSTNLEQLIKHADQAMYNAKEQGKNRYCVYDPGAGAADV